jgi:hypothetical protein
MKRTVGLLGIALLLGCVGGPKSLETIPVQSARLANAWDFGFGALGGGQVGWAQLLIEEPNGDAHALDVNLSGGAIGFLVDAGFSWLPFEGDYDLSAIDAPNAADLLGWFQGKTLQAAMLAGGSMHDLENDANAKLWIGGLQLQLGFTLMAGQEWLFMSLSPEHTCDDEEDNDLDGDTDCADSDCDEDDACRPAFGDGGGEGEGEGESCQPVPADLEPDQEVSLGLLSGRDARIGESITLEVGLASCCYFFEPLTNPCPLRGL